MCVRYTQGLDCVGWGCAFYDVVVMFCVLPIPAAGTGGVLFLGFLTRGPLRTRCPLFPLVFQMRATTPDEFRDEIRHMGKWDEWKAIQKEMLGRGMEKSESWLESAKMFGYRGRDYNSDSQEVSKRKRRSRLKDERLAPREAFAGKTGSVRSDFNWVYENLSVEGVEPGDAPSPGSWGLLQFARDDPKEFYRSWMGMAAREADGDAVMESFRADAERTSAEIGRMLDGMRVVRSDSEGDGGKPRLATGVVIGSVNGSGDAEGSVDSV